MCHMYHIIHLDEGWQSRRVDEISFRDVVQLVECLVWDQEVARSSRVIPTKYKNDYLTNTGQSLRP